jgi:hypothetical protein
MEALPVILKGTVARSFRDAGRPEINPRLSLFLKQDFMQAV